jgi:hypothetical protein
MTIRSLAGMVKCDGAGGVDVAARALARGNRATTERIAAIDLS